MRLADYEDPERIPWDEFPEFRQSFRKVSKRYLPHLLKKTKGEGSEVALLGREMDRVQEMVF